MTNLIKLLVDEKMESVVSRIKKWGRESVYNNSRNYLNGYLRALVETGFLETEEQSKILLDFDEKTLGYVKEK